MARTWPKLHPFPAYPALFGAFTTLASASAFAVEYAKVSIDRRASGGTECSSEGSLAAAVEQRLARRLFVPKAEADLLVAVSFGQTSREWFADIDLFAAHGRHLGHRRITSATQACAGLDDSLALVVALMVDLTKEDVAARATPTLPLPPTRTTEVRVPAQPEESNAWSAVLTIGASATLGQLPKLGLGLWLATELRSKISWSLELAMQALPPVTIDDGALGQATFSYYGTEMGACWFGSRRATSELQLCAGPQVGIERAVGIGYASNRNAQVTSFGSFLKAQSTWWPAPRFGLRLGLGATAPLVRDQFYATRADGSQNPLFKPAMIVPFLNVGLCLAL